MISKIGKLSTHVEFFNLACRRWLWIKIIISDVDIVIAMVSTTENIVVILF